MSRRAFRYHLRSPSSALHLALDHGRVVGYTLTLSRQRSSHARLYSIAVAPTARGRGIATALLAAAEEDALRRHASAMRLEVAADNAAAIALYRKLGYLPWGSIPAYYEDGGDALRMRRSLTGGSATGDPRATPLSGMRS